MARNDGTLSICTHMFTAGTFGGFLEGFFAVVHQAAGVTKTNYIRDNQAICCN